MSLLKKLNISAGVQNSAFEDVAVPELGKDAEIRVQKLRVAGQIRLNELHNIIEKMKVKDKNRINLLYTTAMLMCTMVDEDGEYLVQSDDISATLDALDSQGVFFKLFMANSRVNNVTVENADETLEDAKKNS